MMMKRILLTVALMGLCGVMASDAEAGHGRHGHVRNYGHQHAMRWHGRQSHYYFRHRPAVYYHTYGVPSYYYGGYGVGYGYGYGYGYYPSGVSLTIGF